jgi:hypothetical protein
MFQLEHISHMFQPEHYAETEDRNPSESLSALLRGLDLEQGERLGHAASSENRTVLL